MCYERIRQRDRKEEASVPMVSFILQETKWSKLKFKIFNTAYKLLFTSSHVIKVLVGKEELYCLFLINKC